MRKHIVPDLVGKQSIASMPADAHVIDAAKMMSDRHVKSILVTKDAHLEGILTVSDIVYRVVGDGKDPSAVSIGDVMTTEPQTVDANESPLRALRLMKDGGFWHMPVTDGEQVVGVLSRSDFEGDEMALSDQETGLWEHLR